MKLTSVRIALAALAVPAAVVMLAHASEREFVAELGPVDLPARADHHAVAQPAVRAVTLPADGWLRGYVIELVDRSGRPVPQRMLHHVNLIAPERRELFSPIMLRLGAAGPETSPVVLPRALGLPVRRGDTLVLSAMLHNPTDRAYAGVRIRVRMPYVARGHGIGALAVYPFYVDVMPPAGTHAFDLPLGRSERFWEGRPAVAGRVIGVGGHLHRYGVALRFEDITAGRLLWETGARTDAAGHVTGVPRKLFLWPPGVRLDVRHVYRLTAVYDNPTGATIPGGGMGTLGGVFRPDGGASWAPAERQDPEYRRDVQVTWRVDGGHRGSDAAMPGRGAHSH